MAYWRYWELNSPPFCCGSREPIFRGATVEEALARIEFLISNQRNLGVLRGPSGIGKSTIMRYVTELPPTAPGVPTPRVIRSSLLGSGSGELLTNLASSLTGTRRESDIQVAWGQVCDYFRAAQREQIPTVLMLDDAESSSAGAEADMSRLLSMAFPLTIILAAELEMVGAIGTALLERSELQIELPAWEVSQTAEFLAWSLAQVGRQTPIFTDEAVNRIQTLSQGIPRRIVQVADLALVAGAVTQADHVSGSCVDQVAWELPKSNVA